MGASTAASLPPTTPKSLPDDRRCGSFDRRRKDEDASPLTKGEGQGEKGRASAVVPIAVPASAGMTGALPQCPFAAAGMTGTPLR
jgi:hypothetical protein